MINSQIKKNKGFTSTPNLKNKANLVSGFTLVETMFAVFILTSTIVGLMTIVANSLFATRYARDEITVNYLLQEAVDYIRNDRDTIVFFQNNETWEVFVQKYKIPCASSTGCTLDAMTRNNPKQCSFSSGCPYLYYDKDADTSPFYVIDNGVNMSPKIKTGFRRKIVFQQNPVNPDEINITVTVDWKNGNLPMSRSLKASLMKWE